MSSKILGRIFVKKYVGRNMEKTPKQIQENRIINHELHVNYELARMVKGHAISMLYRDGDSLFSKLPGYLYQLETTNKGSYTKLLKDKNDVFKYVFFALGASISGFTRYGRLVIVIDGIYLKGKYHGTLFVVVTQDGNGQFFPLASGVGNVGCNESWTWFLRCLREAFWLSTGFDLRF
ncbi:hypothetical protein ACS0TY_002695 [Phlomoides rotata]